MLYNDFSIIFKLLNHYIFFKNIFSQFRKSHDDNQKMTLAIQLSFSAIESKKSN